MMKKILIALVVIIAIAVVVSTLLFSKLDGLIADIIRTEGTAAIGSAVTVDRVETRLTEGIVIIDGLAIANPAGYKNPYAFKINNFSADVDYQSQLIEKILIDQPIINAELKGTRSNFQDLLDGMPDQPETAEEPSGGDDTVITINSLQLRKATVNLDSDKFGQIPFVMDDFVMNNLQGTVDQLSKKITGKLVSHVTSQITRVATAKIAAMVKDEALKQAKEAVNEKLKEQLPEGLENKLGGKLKNLKLKLN